MSQFRPRLRFKPSLPDQLRRNQKAMDYLHALSPREDAERFDVGAKPKRERGPVNVDESEAPVAAAVRELLACHPAVAIAIRVNGGAAATETNSVVWFHYLVRGDGRLVDYIGTLKDGRPFAIECKRADWKGVSQGSSEKARREQDQERYILHVRRIGGVSGFARSVDEALAIVEEKGER